jgi:hypothetical protein
LGDVAGFARSKAKRPTRKHRTDTHLAVIFFCTSLAAVVAVPATSATPSTPSMPPSSSGVGSSPIWASVPRPVVASMTIEVTKPIIARRPHQTSAKGRKPKMPSSVGRPIESAYWGGEGMRGGGVKEGGRVVSGGRAAPCAGREGADRAQRCELGGAARIECDGSGKRGGLMLRGLEPRERRGARERALHAGAARRDGGRQRKLVAGGAPALCAPVRMARFERPPVQL